MFMIPSQATKTPANHTKRPLIDERQIRHKKAQEAQASVTVQFYSFAHAFECGS